MPLFSPPPWGGRSAGGRVGGGLRRTANVNGGPNAPPPTRRCAATSPARGEVKTKAQRDRFNVIQYDTRPAYQPGPVPAARPPGAAVLAAPGWASGFERT